MLSKLLSKIRRSPFEPVAIHGDREAGRLIAEVVAYPDRSGGSLEMERRIEAIRNELLASDLPLAPWDRPWLGESRELRDRLDVPNDSDGRFEVQMSQGEAVRASKKLQWCRVLLSLTRHLKPASVLEMGTNVGISALYIAAGLALNDRGKLVTLEGSASKADLARANIGRLGFDRAEVITGDFAQTLEPSIAGLRPVDLAFIDGFHEGKATVGYHHLCKSSASPGAVFVYDDINWSEGMQNAWKEIVRDGSVGVSLDYGNVGIVQLR